MNKRALLLIGALSLPLIAGACGAARPAMPRMGMFVLWPRDADGTDRGGREANLRAREQSLGLPPSSLLALDYFGADSWQAMAEYAWVPAYWRRANPARELIWSIGLTMKGTTLKEVAGGAHDADFEAAAQAIAASRPDAIARIGWEMNGDWFPWSAGGVEADYIAAYRRVVGIFRKVSPRFTFAWCANAGQLASSPELAYPGDDVVDTIGLDIYDAPSAATPAEAWKSGFEGPFGLRWLEDFAARHGKPMHIGEWGVGLKGAPDNPYFVEKMSEWLRREARSIAFHVYFDAPPADLDSGKFPKSRERFMRLFSGAGR
jgi:hypothetical protein